MQSAYPVVQLATWHVPAVHAAPPCATKHCLPQPPQLSMSVDAFVSQPFDEIASQSASGAVHADTPQMPFVQLGVPPVAWHTCPQPPQWSTFFVVSISQPFAGCPSQSENPGLHATEHPASAQVAVALFVVDVAFSRWWLASHPYGPLEWLWRSATYARWQRWRIVGREAEVGSVAVR